MNLLLEAGLETLSSLQLPRVIEGGDDHIVVATACSGRRLREPRYGPFLAQAATYRVDLENYDWADDSAKEENRRSAIELSRQAVGLAPDDPGVLGRAAVVLGRFGEDIHAALALIDRTLVLNPSFAFAWCWSGWLRLFAGDTDLAIQHFETFDAPQPAWAKGLPSVRYWHGAFPQPTI